MIKAHWQVRATHFHACTYAWVCVCVWLMARIIVTDTKGHYWYNRQRISCEGQCGNTKSQDLQQKTSGSTIGDNFISAQILSLSVYMYPCERICYAVVYSAALSYAILCYAMQCNAMLCFVIWCVCVCAGMSAHVYLYVYDTNTSVYACEYEYAAEHAYARLSVYDHENEYVQVHIFSCIYICINKYIYMYTPSAQCYAKIGNRNSAINP